MGPPNKNPQLAGCYVKLIRVGSVNTSKEDLPKE